MPKYACRVCGQLSDQRKCPAHRREGDTSWSGNRDRVAQMRFRNLVLERDGFRCTFIERSGSRCQRTDGLRACHYPIALREFPPGDQAAYDPANGVTLCARHDRMLDPSAR